MTRQSIAEDDMAGPRRVASRRTGAYVTGVKDHDSGSARVRRMPSASPKARGVAVIGSLVHVAPDVPLTSDLKGRSVAPQCPLDAAGLSFFPAPPGFARSALPLTWAARRLRCAGPRDVV